ncbi:MAG: hypothetical protein ACI4JC_00355 [Faecalibacterium sp.]
MFSHLLRQIVLSIGVVFRTIRAFFVRQIYTVFARVKSATSLTRQASKIAPQLLKTASAAGQKPTRREDYVETGQLYIAKSLIVMVVIGLILLALLFRFAAWPLLCRWFFTMKFWEQDKALADHTGKVIVYYDAEKTQPQFKGAVKDGTLQGRAEQYAPDGQILYAGNFVDGLYEGEGVLYQDGQKLYEGTFAGGLYSGSGKLYENDLLVYDGSFSEGLYDGSGTLFQDGQCIYEGGFLSGERSGIGTAYRSGELLYEGEFARDQYNGTGTAYRSGALYYKGGFRDGLFDGEGTEYYSDGSVRYRGGFSEGLYCGSGVLNRRDGTTIRGNFEAGQTVGEATCEKEQIQYYRGLLSGFWPNIAGTFLDPVGKELYCGAVAAGAPDGGALLSLPVSELRELLGGSLEETLGDSGFVLSVRGLGLSFSCSFAQQDAEAAVKAMYLYPGGTQTLLWDSAAGFARAAAASGLSLSEPTRLRGRPKLPEGVPVMVTKNWYAVEYSLENGTLRLWSETEDGALALAEWTSGDAGSDEKWVVLEGSASGGESAASAALSGLLNRLGLAKESAAAAAVDNPFCGGEDPAQLLTLAKESGQLYPVLEAAAEYLRSAEDLAAVQENAALCYELLDDEKALLLAGRGDEARLETLEQQCAELELRQEQDTVELRRQTLAVKSMTGADLSAYDLQTLPVAFRVSELDADGLGKALIRQAQRTAAAQLLGKDGTQTVSRVDEQAILDQMELELLELDLAYQKIGQARDRYVSALDSRSKREREYAVGAAEERQVKEARMEENTRRAALYDALLTFTRQAAALDERAGGWIAREYDWYADILSAAAESSGAQDGGSAVPAGTAETTSPAGGMPDQAAGTDMPDGAASGKEDAPPYQGLLDQVMDFAQGLLPGKDKT